MILQKWDYETRSYKEFNSPAKNAYLYSDDMNALVDCAECGKEIFYGDGFTSREIHNSIGLGYPVCEQCYDTALAKQIK